MHFEYPVREEHVRTLMHKYVGVILLDGTRHYGVVTGCRKGRLILNGKDKGEAEVDSKRAKRRAVKGNVRTKAIRKKKASAAKALPPPVPFGPYGPGLLPAPLSYVALDLASIALLFALLP